MTKKTNTKSPDTSAPQEEPSFEEALASLEKIIDRIESGETPLEESIQEYEKGVKHIKRCREMLDKAEQRISELSLDDESKEAD